MPTSDQLPLVTGSVTVDVSNNYRRACNVTLADPTGVWAPPPQSRDAPLMPYGNEIALYRSIAGFPTVPLGVFQITKVQIDDAPEGQTITVTGNDRSYHVAIQKWTDVYNIAAGTNLNTAIQNIVSPRFDFPVTYNLPPTSSTTAAMTFGLSSSDDPWAACVSIAQAAGNQVFFDASGVCTMLPWPNPNQLSPVWTLSEGPNCVMSQINRSIDSAKVYNHVIVYAESSSLTSPMRADAEITDITNPLYVGGPYGDVPYIKTTRIVTDQTTLQNMANGLLLSYLGGQEQVSVDTVPNPALDVNDVVQIYRQRSNTIGNYIVTSIKMPLEAESLMTFTASLVVNL